MNCSQLEIKAKKPESKNEYKNLVVKLNKRCKNGFFLTTLKQEINLSRFDQLLSDISPINMQRVIEIFFLLKIITFYLITVK